jgi:hypothetical protein
MWACLPLFFANNTKISPQKCTTLEEIFLCYFRIRMKAGQVNVNWNFGQVDKRTSRYKSV